MRFRRSGSRSVKSFRTWARKTDWSVPEALAWNPAASKAAIITINRGSVRNETPYSDRSNEVPGRCGTAGVGFCAGAGWANVTEQEKARRIAETKVFILRNKNVVMAEISN